MRLSDNKTNNLILIGMPAAGKSTVGVILAKATNRNFIDSDILIQEKTGKLLKELIAEHGSDGFARLEDEINSGIDVNNTVIAPGGSVIYGENAMKHFSDIGTIIYLKVDGATLDKRLGDLDARGVVHRPGETIYDIMKRRQPLYEKYADITIEEPAGDFSVEKIMERIMAVLTPGEN